MSLLGLLSGTGSYPVEGYILFALGFFLFAWMLNLLMQWISNKPWRRATAPIGEMHSASECVSQDAEGEKPDDSTGDDNLYALVKS